MKYVNSLLYPMLFSGLIIFTSCEENEENTTPGGKTQTLTVEDLQTSGSRAEPAPTYFDLEEGKVVDDASTSHWDIAFDNTSVLVNSGISGPGQVEAQIVEGAFDDILSAPEEGYRMDTEAELAVPSGDESGWYNYTGMDSQPNHAILPIPGRVIVIHTSEGNYAKVEILSWYKGNPDTSTEEFANNLETRESGYFTFTYAIQPDGSRNF